MSRTKSDFQNFATRLIVHEANGNSFSSVTIPSACFAFEKLRPHLSTIMGTIGFNALLSRSLALAKTEVPSLRSVQIAPTGSFEGFEELATQNKSDEIFNGCVIMLGHLLGLLVTFIGEDLTLRLTREVWPEISPDDLVFG